MIHVTCQMWGSLTRSGHQHRAKAELTCTTLQRLVRFPWVPYRSLPMKMRPEESIRIWLVVQSTSITIHDKDVSQVMIRCWSATSARLISLRRHNMIWSDISWLSRSIYSRLIMSFGLGRYSEADPVVRGSGWDKEDQQSEEKSGHISMRENVNQ